VAVRLRHRIQPVVARVLPCDLPRVARRGRAVLSSPPASLAQPRRNQERWNEV
jgi:hypothetical protein